MGSGKETLRPLGGHFKFVRLRVPIGAPCRGMEGGTGEKEEAGERGELPLQE